MDIAVLLIFMMPPEAWMRPSIPLDDMGCIPLWSHVMGIQTELLAEIEAYISPRKIAATTFGILAVNDGKLVSRLRSGKDLKATTIDRVREFLQSREEIAQ